jgi:hypothetical protein
MVTKFLALAVVGAMGWIVVDGSRQPTAPSLGGGVDALTPAPTVVAGQAMTLEVRQDPVPLVRQHPVPIAGNVDPTTDSQAAADAPNLQPQGKFDSDAARLAAEADGYKRVSIVGKASNGAWRVKGYRGATEVLLAVDDTGRVSME